MFYLLLQNIRLEKENWIDPVLAQNKLPNLILLTFSLKEYFKVMK